MKFSPITSLPRWIALASLASFLVLVFAPAQALTDSNADLKEATADRGSRVSLSRVAGPASRGPVPHVVWVPVAAKRLDSFKPVLPPASIQIAQQ